MGVDTSPLSYLANVGTRDRPMGESRSNEEGWPARNGDDVNERGGSGSAGRG